mgnify:CR=1 FL=1
MNVVIGSTVYFDFATTSFATGAAANASAVGAMVYEDNGTAALSGVSVAQISTNTGEYRIAVVATAGNGFEVGKTYNVWATATVGGVAGKACIATFLGVDALPDNAGIAAIKAKTDNLPADTNTLLTSTGIKISSIANGAIATTTFAAGALDAVWSATSRTLTAISDSSGITTLLSRIGSALTISGGKVTVGSNDDKTGYELTATYDAAKTAATQASVNAIPTAPLLAANYIAPDNAGITAANAAIAALHDFDPATDTVAHVTLADTTTTLTNAPDVPTEAEIAAAVLASAVESGQTVKQTLRLMLSALAGKLSGAAGTTVTIRNAGDTKNRIVATVDAAGNRTAVTYDTSD